MEDPGVQIKTLIHHILHRHNIYKMDIAQLHQVLHLLREEPTDQPIDIQERLFRGIVKFNQQYRDHVSLALSEQQFQEVSFDIKFLMHKILHEYYFLNAIKAWEMFVPHFQQPGIHSRLNANQSPSQLLDDQYEKARLHYQYYGPMSVYHLNQQLPQLPPQPQPQPQPPLFTNFQQHFQYMRPEKRPEFDYPKPPRGRPPLNRPKNPEMNGLKPKPRIDVTSPAKRKPFQRQFPDNPQEPAMGYQGEQMEGQQEQVENNEYNLQHCLCNGSIKNAQISRCKCKKWFHPECQGYEKKCLSCRQAEYDPFNQVVWLLGTFSLNWDEKESFEGYINMSSHSSIFSTMQYGVMVTCAHPQCPGICWPDDILFKLNDRPVFEVPALLEAHGQKRRKDRQLIITPYLADLKSNPLALGRLRFSIERIKPANDINLPRRNNRSGTFQLCFFVVKQITRDEIFSRVIDVYSQRQRVAPFEWNFYEVVPDRLTISVFDPYTYDLMDCPARGVNCKHLQCFDLLTFLTMIYETSCREWACPFCGKDARELLIDKYQLSLLKSLRPGERPPKSITFYQDGKIHYEKGQESEESDPQNSRD